MALDDTGLVSRYWFDEAASGSAPTQVDDASANAYHLTNVDYGGGNLAWTEVSGNRGLESTSLTGTQRARRAVDNTSDALRDALAGTGVVTFELVLDVQAGNNSGGRVFGINNRAGGSMVVGVIVSTTQYFMQWNASALSGANLAAGRHVCHFVIDITAGAGESYNVYIDGVNTLSGNAATALTIPADVDLIAFNRENAGGYDRSWDGILFYAAIYDVAFDDARAAAHATELAADDDDPGGGPAPTPSRGLMTLGVG
jgi:hypothetical protein